jgi:hypothetical protein
VTRGQIVTGVDVDGYEVRVFCPHTPEGDAMAKWLASRMVRANMALNYAVSREALARSLESKE